MAVALSAEEAEPYIAQVRQAGTWGPVVACLNSPKSITISGTVPQIKALNEILNNASIFARQLKVAVAYHSPQMEVIASDYEQILAPLCKDRRGKNVGMISSVTGEQADLDSLRAPAYWVKNMVSPVNFTEAVTKLCETSPKDITKKLNRSHLSAIAVDYLLEIGPHGALKGPIREILRGQTRGSEITYDAVLNRGTSALTTVLSAVGRLHCAGYNVNFDAINKIDLGSTQSTIKSLPDLPEYQFNHSQAHWHESRISSDHKHSNNRHTELLGRKSLDWNPRAPRWRQFLRIKEMPWIEDHKINGVVLYPGAGMMVMAIEAARQLYTDRDILSYQLSDVHFSAALDLTANKGELETQVSLSPRKDAASANHPTLDFVVTSYSQQQWIENCSGSIRVQCRDGTDSDVQRAPTRPLKLQGVARNVQARPYYDFLLESGYGYGTTFQRIKSIDTFDGEALASVSLFPHLQKSHVVHPATLDAIMHLMFAATSDGCKKAIGTSIPTKLASLWISADGLGYPSGDSVKVHSKVTLQSHRFTNASCYAVSEDGSRELLSIDGLETTTVSFASKEPTTSRHELQTLAHIDTKPDIDMVSDDRMLTYLKQSGTSQITTRDSVMRYIDLMAHKSPAMHILEIAAGHGELTTQVMDTLQRHSDGEIGLLRCESYTCTDTDQSSLDQIQVNCSQYEDKMNFQTLDLSINAPKTQVYDLVIASLNVEVQGQIENALHEFVKPGGTLILHYATSTTSKGSLDGPQMIVQSAISTASELVLAGASQNRFVIKRGEALSLRQEVVTSDMQLLLIVEKESAVQPRLAQQLQTYAQCMGYSCETRTVEEAAASLDIHERQCIYLPELERPYLQSLNEQAYDNLKALLRKSSYMLWLTKGGGRSPTDPGFSVIDGFARSIRLEVHNLKLATLALQSDAFLQPTQLETILRVMNQTFRSPGLEEYEREYIEIDGMVHINRVVQAVACKEDFLDRLSPRELVQTVADAGSVVLTIERPGELDSLRFIKDPQAQHVMKDEDFEIAVTTFALTTNDSSIISGRSTESKIGSECCGIIEKAGPTSGLQVSDRVWMLGDGLSRTIARASNAPIVKLPLGISFEQVSSLPRGSAAVAYALYQVLCIDHAGSLLLRCGREHTDAAVQMALHSKVELFVSVGSDEEKQTLVENYSLDSDHVLTEECFGSTVRRMTGGQGVDFVLNACDGATDEVREAIAKFGVLAELDLGHRDTSTASSYGPHSVSSNATMTRIDWKAAMEERPRLARTAMDRVVTFAEMNVLRPCGNVGMVPISAIRRGFEQLQGAEASSKVVVTVAADEEIMVRLKIYTRSSDANESKIKQHLKETYNLSADATYVISGGLSGLGRSIARWSARKGAKHLILLSRSGAKTEEAKKCVAYLQRYGVNVETPQCDITNIDAVQECMNRYATSMPPVRGCFHLGKAGLVSHPSREIHQRTMTDINPRMPYLRIALIPNGLLTWVPRHMVPGISTKSSQLAWISSSCPRLSAVCLVLYLYRHTLLQILTLKDSRVSAQQWERMPQHCV